MNTADTSVTSTSARFLSGGGEMGELTRNFDWSNHSLGPVEQWPQSLKATLGIILHSAFPMFLFWGDDLICFYNDAYRPSLGVSGKHPAVGKPGKEIWPEIWNFIGPLIEKVTATGESVWFEDQYLPIFRNGRLEDVYWTFSYSPAFNDSGKIDGVFVTCTETTGKVEMLRNLEESHQRFQSLVSQATVATLVLMGPELVIEIVNDAYAKLLGRGSDQLLGKKIFDVVPEAEEPFRKIIEEVRTTGKSRYLSEQHYRVNVNGEMNDRYLDLVYKPYFDQLNAIQGVMILCQDVTENVVAKRKIQESEERFEAAVQAVEGVVWTNSVDGRMVGEQPGWSSLTGQSQEEYEGYGWANAVHPDDVKQSIDVWKEAVRERKTFIFKHRLRVRDGSYRIFSIRAVPLKNADGTIREWVGVHTDITEHHQAEEILKESEERFRSLADNSPMIVYIVEPTEEATMRYFNKPWLTYTGQTFDEALGRAWDGIVHPDDVQGILDTYVPAFQQRVSYTLPGVRLKRFDGEYRWHFFKGNPRYLPNGEFIGFVGVGIDIHEQKVVQEALKESEERFRNLADHAPMFIWMVDQQAVITYANRELLNFIGAKSETEVATEGGWEKVTHPDDLPNVYAAFMEGFTLRKEYEVEARLRNSTEDNYEWFLFKAAPRIMANGEFTGFIGTAVSIHQQKMLLTEMEERVQLRTKELNIANEALLQSNDDLKQFAHVASHDLKEPVRKIQTFSHRLHDEFTGELAPRAQLYVEKIIRSAERMASMIDGVLTYSSMSASEAKIEFVDLNGVIDNIISDLEVLISKKSGSIVKQNLPRIEGSEVLLYQLFYNLINNSLKFSKVNTAPKVEIESQDAADHVTVIVSDNGIGFDKQYADRIFESFTRLNTKDQFEGTGLGLSLCKKIVQRHGGTIEAHSANQEGATFIIRLPKHQKVEKV